MDAKSDLVIWVQPVLGEPFTVGSAEFESVEAAIERLHQALEEGATMHFSAGRPDRVEGRARSAQTLVNFRHVLAVRVWTSDAEVEDAQYL
ncbi:hypothetical protein FXN61_16710 [Lentzea sp. PSKA42]|uniref:HicB family protein n=1 Tax=Lentzea indica TaxID=2604800 RepID=A0ABX1FI12_9PSEU|nr:hypothetical protein [Lentzea indica]NKE58376.1 hypothetical protein [Lentzea indica]